MRLIACLSVAAVILGACAQGASFPTLAGTGAEGTTSSGAGAGTSTSSSSSGQGTGGSAGTSSSSSSGAGGSTSTTSSTSGSTTSTTSSSTTSSSGTCSASPCELVAPQCGCSGGEACTFVNGAMTPSCGAAGTAGPGQACAGAGTCAPGSICLGGGTAGACAAFCATDADCASEGGICVLTLSNGSGGSIPNEMLCSGSCDPVANTGCVTGMGCQVGVEPTGQMRVFSVCESAGKGVKNGACTTVADCAAKFDCVNTGSQTVCLEYCYVGVTQAGCTTCTPLSAGTAMTPLVLNGKQVGVCQ